MSSDIAPPVVSVAGEIDMANASELHAAVMAVAQRGPTDVVVDLSRVTFIDSTGLGVLVGLRNELPARHDCKLVLRSPSHAVTRVLELTRLVDVFSRSGS